jgi:23S rRNA (adenine2503-C2)-methyltransferase
MIQTFKGLTLKELEKVLKRLGEKTYRARQLYQWMYQQGVRDFQEMTNFPAVLRTRLQAAYVLTLLEPVRRQRSSLDATVKYLFRVRDGALIESVYMEDGDRVTVCLSTMVGCPIGCPFCATGQMGLKRNLTTGEILDQFLWIQREVEQKISNIVFMGMGEPFLNYEPTIQSAQILNSELGPGLAARKITISTCGIVPAIYRFSDEKHKFKLAISLNTATDALRTQLIPINRKYPLADLLEAVQYYTRKLKRRVTFEYILIRGVNDTPAAAENLVRLLSPIPCKLNVIPYNESKFSNFHKPTEKVLDEFMQHIYQAPFAVTVRRSKGSDIAAACGQLFAAESG